MQAAELTPPAPSGRFASTSPALAGRCAALTPLRRLRVGVEACGGSCGERTSAAAHICLALTAYCLIALLWLQLFSNCGDWRWRVQRCAACTGQCRHDRLATGALAGSRGPGANLTWKGCAAPRAGSPSPMASEDSGRRPLVRQFDGGMRVNVHYHKGDLPDGLELGPVVAVDTETLGLSLVRDRLCVVQLSAGDGHAHVVQLDRATYDCPNLKRLLADPAIEKLFHFARFDVAMCRMHLGIDVAPVFCTKIASKLTRTYTDRHGLKDLVKELTGVELSKQQQSSDWGAEELSEAQLHYAASDVLHLHACRARLSMMLEREGRTALAQACFDFLPTRAALDIAGWSEADIFSHA
jgi:ribonuclease D